MPALRALWKGADPDIPSSSTLAGRAGQNSSGSLGTRCGDVWAHRSRGKFACCSRRSSGFRPTHRRMNQAPSNVEPSAERISFLPLHFSVCHRSVSFSNSLFEPLQIEADWDEKYGPLRAGFPLTLLFAGITTETETGKQSLVDVCYWLASGDVSRNSRRKFSRNRRTVISSAS
jgi:hypothetical protein